MTQTNLPVNSAVLVFELGSPEFIAASRAQDLVAVLTNMQEGLRMLAKHGVHNSGTFDFKDALACSTPEAAVQEACHAIRVGIIGMLGDRNLNLEAL